MEPGTVMVLGEEEGLLPSHQACDKRVAGVMRRWVPLILLAAACLGGWRSTSPETKQESRRRDLVDWGWPMPLSGRYCGATGAMP